MSLSKQEFQRILDRVGKLESQVGGMIHKLAAMEIMLKPENLIRRVREGEAEEKRKQEREQMMTGSELALQPKTQGNPG